MQAFQNIALPDNYGTGPSGGEFKSEIGVAAFVSIFNATAAFKILQRDSTRTAGLIELPEQASAPGSFLIEGGAGIFMRNNVPGSVARVFVTIFEPTDPRIAGFNPNSVSISASGSTTALVVGAELAYQEFIALVTITAVTEATADVIVTAPSATFDGATKCCIEFFAPRTQVFSTNTTTFVLFVDGLPIGQLGVNKQNSGLDELDFYAKRYRTPGAGAHTFSVRAFQSGAGGANIYAGAGEAAGVLVPGFIRITIA